MRWSRSERLTAALIPAVGEPIIVTPFFEKPSVAESLGIPAEIRTWDEHEEPLKLVADWLRERKLAAAPVGIEETNRFFIVDRLQARNCRASRCAMPMPVVRGCRMFKSPAEIALMQAATDITIAAIREVHAQIARGHDPARHRRAARSGDGARGGTDPWALVLLGEASAYPHGIGQAAGGAARRGRADRHRLRGARLPVRHFAQLRVRHRRRAEQRTVWEQVAQGQKIAMQAARIGATAGSVDDAVRAAYTRWGYGPGYKLPGLSHRTGHGIGMEGP